MTKCNQMTPLPFKRHSCQMLHFDIQV